MNVLEAHTKGISVCDVRYRKVTWHGALLGMFGEIVLMLSPKDVMYASSASHLDTRALPIPRASRPMITLHSIVLDIRFLICRTYSVFKSRAAAGGDDFILLAVFVGNDFLPNLPDLHIHENGLERLFEIYKKSLPSLGK